MFEMPTDSNFTPLEKAVFVAICETHLADRAVLSTQLASAAFSSRENTGAGFYTHFEVERTSPPTIEHGPLGGPEAKIDGLEHGMGFILWLENGYAKCLEGYCYDESTVGIDFEQVGFEITESN
jgi:hypothetical protein